jgi:hypothetical protein
LSAQRGCKRSHQDRENEKRPSVEVGGGHFANQTHRVRRTELKRNLSAKRRSVESTAEWVAAVLSVTSTRAKSVFGIHHEASLSRRSQFLAHHRASIYQISGWSFVYRRGWTMRRLFIARETRRGEEEGKN